MRELKCPSLKLLIILGKQVRIELDIWDLILSFILSKLSMYSSEAFGRLFWVDDNLDFKSCPQNIDGTGDFDSWDYVSEWTEWEGVNMDLLFNIHKTCLHSKEVYSNSLSLKGE